MLKIKLNRIPLSNVEQPLYGVGFSYGHFQSGWCALTKSWYLTAHHPELELWLMFNLPEGAEIVKLA